MKTTVDDFMNIDLGQLNNQKQDPPALGDKFFSGLATAHKTVGLVLNHLNKTVISVQADDANRLVYQKVSLQKD